MPQMKRTDAGAGAVAAQPLDPRLDHLGPVGEAEVVVRGEHEHLAAALHLDDRPLRRAERVEALVRARLAQAVELGAERAVELVRQRSSVRPPPRPDVASTGSRTGLSAGCGRARAPARVDDDLARLARLEQRERLLELLERRSRR